MLERSVEKHLKARVKQLGGETRKVQWIGRGSAPDRLVMLPEERHANGKYVPGWSFFLELKRPGKEAEDAQAREHARMRRCGLEVYVADTCEKVDELLFSQRPLG